MVFLRVKQVVCRLIAGAALCVALGAAAPVAPFQTFLSLSYSAVGDETLNPDTVSVGRFKEQMDWLKRQGYQPVSVDDILAAHAGKKPLPAKSVFLTFDGGAESFYKYVQPVLQTFHYPAVLVVVDKDMRRGSGSSHAFLTWAQLRQIKQSGLIEIASGGHALYDDVIANPQGDKEHAAVTQRYNVKKHRYAAPQDYDRLLAEDIETAAQNIERETGARPRVMSWPYGAYNQKCIDIATRHGMPLTLTLDSGLANTGNESATPRLQIKGDVTLQDFAASLDAVGRPPPMRAIQADIDYVYDKDAAQMNRNIDALVSRVREVGANVVFLQGFADPNGTELTRSTYFPNRYLPMRADLFNHVAWLLKTRAGVKVFGWIPVFSFDLGRSVTPVMYWDEKTGKAVSSVAGYHRASVFDPRARKIIGDIFGDMARYGVLDGVLFHDDALLTDYEDAGPMALLAYKKAGLPDSIAAIRADASAMDKWTSFKTQALIDFTKELTARVREFRAPVVTVRNIYAPLVLNIRSEEWFAQSYQQFLQAYDMTAIEAMPAMENVPEADADKWMAQLVQKAAATQPDALQHTMFELQSVDWRKAKAGQDRAIPTETLAGQMRFLTSQGVINLGYYPDDFHANNPDAAVLHKDFAVKP